MKRTLFVTMLVCLTLGAWARQVVVETRNISLVMEVEEGRAPRYVYFGAKLSAQDLTHIQQPSADGRMDVYPAYGMNTPAEPAFAVTHADGSMATVLNATGVDTRNDGNATLTTIHTADPVYPVMVDIVFKAYRDVDMIETWTEVTTKEKGITLTRFASGMLPIRRGDVWVSHLYGSWANEAQLVEEPLTPGELIIRNNDGTRNSHTDHGEVMLSLDGKARENSGDVIGAAICYSGNYRLRLVTDDTEYHYFFAGINEDNSEYHLKKGETFKTPHLAKILLNSWEGVYFDINQQGMDQMMKDIASMGGELFVMDDGWFGDKYPRNVDNSSLGDWVVDKRKLPKGIEGLLRDAKKHGVKFGIWIEPEMTNSVSELYEKHPDWVLKAPGRDPVLGRGGTQLVLDLSNPKVQDFCFKIVDDLMSRYPEIDYIKWDANMPMLNHGSQYLPLAEQSHLYIKYHEGFAKVCERIRQKYPDLTIQACASGGGRANWGVLPWFDEFWVSDNTDALQRIYMQWGTSYFFPAIAMASHISIVPNHTVFRTTSLKYRIDVAMSGRLGMEIQPKNMTDEEKAQCRKAIEEYKRIRPVVQFGDIYRLLSPFDHKGAASLMYVTEQKDRAVFYWWKTESFQNEHLPRVRMAGLDPHRMYTIHELDRIDLKPLSFEGKSFSGEYLMNHGLELPYRHDVDWGKKNEWASRVLEITAE